ncbi:MAG: SPASM domain-containing protein [Clostridiaceae bacterium]|nr:SPASM domain-containing protein [Clostridiaceae bacterium]
MNTLTLLVKPAAGLCNMNCRYCFYKAASRTRENRIMTGETADVLIQKIREYRPSALCVMFQGGEPLLAGLEFYKSFAAKIKGNIKAPVSFSLQTNGLLIDDGFAKFFKENGFLVGVSLDGGRRTNDRYRLDANGGSVFEQVLRSISILRKHDVDFNILSVVDGENAGDIESTYTFFKEQGFGFLQFIPCIDENSGVSLTPEKHATFLKKSFDLWYEDFINGRYISMRHIDNYINILMGNPPENCAMCGVCGNYFVVEANGDIYPCDFYCRDEYKIGSVFGERPFEQNEKQKRFIEQSLLIHEKCRECRYYRLCRGGCRRDRDESLTSNVYCKAYKDFFDYSCDRMNKIAELLEGG